MPSKVLIEAANACRDARHLDAMGIRGAAGLRPDSAAVLAYVRSLRDHYVAGVLRQITALGERSLAGQARFLGPDRIAVGDQHYTAESIVIATGSRPVLPEGWKAFGERILTSDDLFEQESLPRRMAVIGLGALGLEMAQALARLDIEVHGFEASQFIGGLTDPVVNEQAIALMRDEFPLYTGAPAELSSGAGGVVVRSGGERMEVERVLVALGRTPNLESLHLESLGLELNERGLPPFSPATGQVGDLRVFIAGDVNGYAPLLHEAADEGHVAGSNAVHEPIQAFARRTPLRICFSAPNIARAGRSFASLGALDPVIGEVDFAGQGRATMTDHDRGYLRLYAEPVSGRMLGTEMCAPQGEHLVHLLAWAIQRRLTVFDILELPFYHPTVEEALRTAIRNAKSRFGDVRGRSELALCECLPVEGMD
jgi:dihydrolipoamide dehydrogenase